jgi:hypothetical protein
MTLYKLRGSVVLSVLSSCLLIGLVAGVAVGTAYGQASGNKPAGSGSSAGQSSAASQSSSSQSSQSGQPDQPDQPHEKAPSLIDPAGPTISLTSSEPVFLMSAALNACGYNEGIDDSAPIRKHVRDEVDQALAKSEEARAARDKVCLYIAQHRMTGTEHDVAQYISLALYLTPPPDIET